MLLTEYCPQERKILYRSQFTATHVYPLLSASQQHLLHGFDEDLDACVCVLTLYNEEQSNIIKESVMEWRWRFLRNIKHH